MAESRPFPLLVQGSWGPNPPKTLINKLQMYFQSQKFGRGECKVILQPGNPASFLVLFSLEEVRQNVLEKGNHKLVWPGKGTFKLTVWLPEDPDEASVSKKAVPGKESKTKKEATGKDDLDSTHSPSNRMEDVPKECETVSSMVAFENLPEKVTDIVLTILVENISGLPSDDFKVEVIRDFGVAVVTFQKPIDTKKFISDCISHHSNRQLQLSPRLLERTNVVRVENLPPGVDDYKLQLYFESPFNGGGRVTHVECFPEESSALVEFSDSKVLDTILAKKHSFHEMPLSVFPYYPSLGTALYGEEKPLVKLPAPFQESLGLPLWKFFQKHNHLIKEINDKMRRCHCELTWSDINGTVTIRPAATLVNHRPSIKTWQRDASKLLSGIKSEYEVKVFEVYPPVWDIIRHELGDDRVLMEFDKESLTLAGKSEDVQGIGQKIKELIDSTTEQVRKEEQSLKEKVAISPGKHFPFQHSGFLDDLSKENPETEIHYDAATQHLCFKGFYTDVYKVKCDIQEDMYFNAQKDVPIPSEVFMFLQQVDSQEFSKTLFEAQKIPAIYDLNGSALLLTACSFRALAEAEKKMLDALSYKIIEVEDKKVFRDNAWKKKINPLQKRHSSRASIMIKNKLTSGTPAEVIIAGCVKEVNEIYDQLLEFLENTMKIERLVKIEPFLIIEYLRTDKNLFWPKIRKANVQASFKMEDKTKGILLTGSKSKVLECMNMVKQILDSVCIKRFQIDKPGARHLFQDKTSYYKSEIYRLYGCIIELQEGAEKEKGSLEEQKCLLQKDIAPGVTLIVQQGDLARFPADVVVNGANENLKHINGLALTLSNAAGTELQAECDKIVRKRGVIPSGNAVISKPGKLPCQYVVHAVGPWWDKNKAQECVSLLKRAVEQSLSLAEAAKCQSIAMPAIGSGIFGFPLDLCVATIVLAIKDNFQRKSDRHTLKKIYLVDISAKVAGAFAEAVETTYKATLSHAASQSSLTALELVSPEKTPQKPQTQDYVLMSPEGLKIWLVKEGIQNAKTHVIVNSISLDLSLNKRPRSKALLEKAGPELQKELNEAGQGVSVKAGTILQTSGCNLNCHRVFHVVVPQWKDNDSAWSLKIMKNIIRDCLETAETLSLQSIGFPALGTGNLGFPKPELAKLIISEVLKFSSMNHLKTLQEVQFLLHPKDLENIQAFSEEFDKRSHGNPSDTQGFYGSLSSPTLGVHEMNIGPILFQVATGDITKEVADVIVNSTSNTFDLKSGVSKAILEGAGPSVEKKCSVLAQQNSECIITEGGSLRCKSIIHVHGGNDVKRSVSCVLEECEKRNYSSICLPAIGTGSAQQDPDAVAKAMMDAIEEFIQKTSVQAVKKVKVVIFQPHILDVFYNNMKDREGSPAPPEPSLLSKISCFSKHTPHKQNTLFLKKKIEQAVFQVCGKDEDSVGRTISWIQNLITQEQHSYRSDDECVKDFGEKEYKKLNELQERLNIVIELDQKTPLIEVAGISRDVIGARDEIENLIKSIRLAKEKENQADYVLIFVEWRYIDNNVIHCFDKIATVQLEEARQAKQTSTVVKINNQDFTVNLRTNTATGPQGQSVTVQRILKDEETTKKPEEDPRPRPRNLAQAAELHTSKMPAALPSSSCPPSPLLVRLQKSIPGVHRKIKKYFESQDSEGGECSVQSVDPSAPDTFQVNFLEGAAKKRVLKKRKHQMVIDGKPVAIFLETTRKSVEAPRTRPPSLTQPTKSPTFRRSFLKKTTETTSSRPPSLKKTADTSSSRPRSWAQPAETTSSRSPSVTKTVDASSSRRISLTKPAELHTSKMPTTLPSSPCPPSPLLVRLQKSIPGAHRKIKKYFESQDPEGGECSVQPVGPSAPDTFQVNFLERAAKKRVLKKRKHQMVIDGKPVAISLETTKKPGELEGPSSRSPSLTQPAEIHTSKMPTAMASSSCPPSPLLVRLQKSIPRVPSKLKIYFESQDSEGGECSVQPVGPSAPYTFEVYFEENAAKKRVLRKREHEMVIDGKPVAIFLETTKKPVENRRPRPPSVTQSLNEALSDEEFAYDSDDAIVQMRPETKQYVFKRMGLSLPSGKSLNVDHKTPMDIDRNDSNAASSPLRGSADSSGALKANDNEDSCAICMDTISNKHVLPKCKHEFCSSCITKALSSKPVCPWCQSSYGIQKGNQPDGTITSYTLSQSLPGYEDCGTIEIQYFIKSGIQTDEHPNPGKPYRGTRRTAYLPDNEEGRKVLGLLREAFSKRLIFTIRDSRVPGMSDVITWNGIHHKIYAFGGPGNFGYPDPHYLTRVKEELKAKGIE